MLIAGSIATWLSTGFAAVAAVASVVAVLVARRTVNEAAGARRDASTAHREELRQETALLESTKGAHREEMAERVEAYQRTISVQRVELLARIADGLREIGDTARSELVAEHHSFDWSPVPGILTHLDFRIAAFEALGGHVLPELRDFSRLGKMRNADRARLVGDSVTQLQKLGAVVERERITLEALDDDAQARRARERAH